MSQPAWNDDETLLAELAAALKEIEPLRESVAERGRGAYAWRTIDDDLALAAIAFDSSLESETVLRDDDDDAARVLVFEADGISVELEVSPGRVAGQLLPPSEGRITVEQQTGLIEPASEVTVEADELGFFVVHGGVQGVVRLHCETPGAKLVTEWVRL